MKISWGENGVIQFELSQRECEQVQMEIDYLQTDARVRGPILERIRSILEKGGIPQAAYPGHFDVWPGEVPVEGDLSG